MVNIAFILLFLSSMRAYFVERCVNLLRTHSSFKYDILVMISILYSLYYGYSLDRDFQQFEVAINDILEILRLHGLDLSLLPDLVRMAHNEMQIA